MGGNWTGQWQGKWEGRLIGPIDPNYLSGVASFQLAALGQAYGVGTIHGGAYVQLATAGSIESGVTPAYISGASSMVFGASATLVGVLLASGSASVVFDASGNGYLAVNAAGAAGIEFGTIGATTGIGAAAGTAPIEFFGGATLSGVGRLSGQSDILVTPSGEIFSPLWASGETGITVGITGQINGAAWASGAVDVSLASSGLLSGIGHLAGAAWTILNTRHVDLTKFQRLYVRAVLDAAYTSAEVEQIVATATQNTLSVMDAAAAVRASVEPLQIIVAATTKRKPKEQKTVASSVPQQERENKPAHVVAGMQTLYAQSEGAPIYASSSQH